MLTSYLTTTRELLHDPNAQFFSDSDLTNYINIGRKRIAIRGQCVRILLSGGTITSIAGAPSGSGYAGTATVTITGSGQQARATATIGGGQIATVTLVSGGWGYITGTTTTVTATGSTSGNNATLTAVIDNSLTTVAGQEVYNFSTANTLAASTAGVSSILGLVSVACAWGANAAMKPMLQPTIWSEFQAYYRAYNNGMQNYPTIWSQYGQGVNGSVYLWPIPSQPSQMDWDCYCVPIDLVNDSTVEAIPYPWSDCVPYYAAMMGYRNAQRKDDADRMQKELEMYMKEARASSETPFVPDYYSSDV